MIGSPNLSLSTSPSLASPSNSTKSTSNSSTSSISTTTASSSSSSTSSNSPSPALLSPNISSTNRGSSTATRLESPLVGSKTTPSTPSTTTTTTTGTNLINNNYINLHNNTTTTNNNNNNNNNSNNLNNHYSNSRTSFNPTETTNTQASNVSLPLYQNSLQTRINLDNPLKNDLKKNPMASSSSLLSTAVLTTHEPGTSPDLGPTSTPHAKTNNNATPFASKPNNLSSTTTSRTANTTNTTNNNNNNSTNNNNNNKSSESSKLDSISSMQSKYAALSNKLIGAPIADPSSKNPSGPCNSDTKNVNTQPTVPPLIIPVPQKEQPAKNTNPTTSNNLAEAAAAPTPSKPAKTKTPAKSTRKKPVESNVVVPKPEPKPKASRARKAPANSNNETTTTTSTSPKQEATSKRAKSKAATKTTEQATNLAATTATAMTDSESTIKTQTPAPAPAAKRKSRSTSNESSSAPSPTKRLRKKKSDPVSQPNEQTTAASSNLPINVVAGTQPTSTASNVPVGPCGPLMINTPGTNSRIVQGLNSADSQNAGNRYFSPLISPYANFDPSTASSLTRSSLSRLFTASSAVGSQANPLDEPGKAFEELRENVWSQLSKCVLEQAQQFDIPSHIGLLYTLRAENEKLESKLRDMSAKRDQLIAINSRLDMPGPILTKNLNSTSPNFSSLVTGLTNSPQHLVNSSPVSAINKQPLVSVGSYNLVPPGSLGPPGYLDRSSPLVGQSHSGINIKSSSISTPSPPIGAMMAHSNSNRAGLITVNSSYMPNVFSPMGSLAQLGTNPQGASYYSRQQS